MALRSATAQATSARSYWRTLEQDGARAAASLALILTMPYTRNESGSYAWPTAYQESPSEADWQALVDAASTRSRRSTP